MGSGVCPVRGSAGAVVVVARLLRLGRGSPARGGSWGSRGAGPALGAASSFLAPTWTEASPGGPRGTRGSRVVTEVGIGGIAIVSVEMPPE